MNGDGMVTFPRTSTSRCFRDIGPAPSPLFTSGGRLPFFFLTPSLNSLEKLLVDLESFCLKEAVAGWGAFTRLSVSQTACEPEYAHMRMVFM